MNKLKPNILVCISSNKISFFIYCTDAKYFFPINQPALFFV